MRCGLALANANRVRPGFIGLNENDGLLTAREVIDGLDLRGTELVLLVGCGTGRGDVLKATEKSIAGDSLASMRHAFEMAGAHDVIGTAWSIEPYSSQVLLGLFFEALREGQDYETSLRTAQIKAIEHPQLNAHAMLWAGFALTGQLGRGQSP